MDEIFAYLASLLAAVFPAFGPEKTPVYSGYIEADFVYVAPTLTRRLIRLNVAEGETVQEGDLMYEMDANRESAALRAAIARKAAAEANLHNLETGSREEEIEVIRATLKQALAEQELASLNYERSKSLQERGIVPASQVDRDLAALELANGKVEQLRAQLAVAELPARPEQLAAARATLNAAIAEVDLAAANLDELTVLAPVDGLIEKVFYEVGEVAGAGTPVISILPPDDAKVLFYIPETERMDFSPGMELALSCDGCPPDLRAQITRLATDPQFTPPIIYSREERARLVFRADAILIAPSRLLPGQPVTLTRLP